MVANDFRQFAVPTVIRPDHRTPSREISTNRRPLAYVPSRRTGLSSDTDEVDSSPSQRDFDMSVEDDRVLHLRKRRGTLAAVVLSTRSLHRRVARVRLAFGYA